MKTQDCLNQKPNNKPDSDLYFGLWQKQSSFSQLYSINKTIYLLKTLFAQKPKNPT